MKTPKSKKQRLDTLLVERGLVESRERAKRLILAGEVIVDGESQPKPGRLVPAEVAIHIKEQLRYVGRGGLKLEKALQTFEIDVAGKVAIDVGASTGGFTDCLLQHGATFVYALDVGRDQLAWQLRQDGRVRAIERTNIRTIDVRIFDRPIDIAVIDVSFISLKKVIPRVMEIVKSTGDIIALIKPQFEAGREQVGKGGVVRVPAVHVQVIQGLIQFSQQIKLCIKGLTYSPVRGPAGNIEYFMWLNTDIKNSLTGPGNIVVDTVQEALTTLVTAKQKH